MTIEKMLYTAKGQTSVACKHVLLKRPLLHLLFVSLLSGLAIPNPARAQDKRPL